MKTKTPRVYTLDELKEKSQEALTNPKLVEIVKTTPLNKDGKVNLSWVYKEAEKHVHEQTKDLQKTKELAVATRFLGMIRRGFPAEFEKLIAREKQQEPKTEPEVQKKFTDMEFDITFGMQLVSRCQRSEVTPYSTDLEQAIRFPPDRWNQYGPGITAYKLCEKILNALVELEDGSAHPHLRENLIKFIKEKFGIKIDICATCEFYGWINAYDDFCDKSVFNIRRDKTLGMNFSHSCSLWLPKKIRPTTGKKEN